MQEVGYKDQQAKRKHRQLQANNNKMNKFAKLCIVWQLCLKGKRGREFNLIVRYSYNQTKAAV